VSGFAAAKQLASHGAAVILACRDARRGQEAAQLIRSATGNDQVSAEQLDVSDLVSIARFAQRVDKCHILLNNAGAVLGERRAVLGVEGTVATNYLGPWYLTRLLLPVLAKTSLEDCCETRVINVGSRSETTCALGEAFAAGGVPAVQKAFFSLDGGEAHKPMKQYALSKLGNMLFTYELSRRLQVTLDSNRDGDALSASLFVFPPTATVQVKSSERTPQCRPRIVCNAVTPGFTNTNIFRFSSSFAQYVSYPLRAAMLKSVDKGGAELVYAASQAGVTGRYFGEHMEVSSSEAAKSVSLGSALWTLTESVVQDQLAHAKR
jgi:NAD(P)-dependent dehydrogenase (short-subunit alcohol dehydrogenase family)